jgi:predicted O-methyltransferase YrrM
MSDSFTVMNMLFDQAIDELIEAEERFDCVFIDGQHEQEATLHYAERVRPLMNEGSCFVFDDIYWSDGMNQAWKELCRMESFSHTVDLLYKGICVYEPHTRTTVHHDLGDVLPRPTIFRKGF